MNGYNPETGLYDLDGYPYTYATTPQKENLGQAPVTPEIAERKAVLAKAKILPWLMLAGISLIIFPQLGRSIKKIVR